MYLKISDRFIFDQKNKRENMNGIMRNGKEKTAICAPSSEWSGVPAHTIPNLYFA